MEKTREQMQAMERSLAYEFATSVLNGLLVNAEAPHGMTGDWFDLSFCAQLHRDDVAVVGEAVEYLEWRGLIVRDSAQPHLLSIHEESEATGGEGLLRDLPLREFNELDLDAEVEELADAVMDLGLALAAGDDNLTEIRIDAALTQVDEVRDDLLSMKRHYEAAQEQTGKAGA